jgi:hypothetical protein
MNSLTRGSMLEYTLSERFEIGGLLLRGLRRRLMHFDGAFGKYAALREFRFECTQSFAQNIDLGC